MTEISHHRDFPSSKLAVAVVLAVVLAVVKVMEYTLMQVAPNGQYSHCKTYWFKDDMEVVNQHRGAVIKGMVDYLVEHVTKTSFGQWAMCEDELDIEDSDIA